MTRWPDPALLARVGMTVPIIQAPMANAGGVALAVAAIEAGAVGSLPCAMLSPERMRDEVAAVRARVSGPINLNFFCHRLGPVPDDAAWLARLAPYYAEYNAAPPADPPPLRAPFDAAMCAAVEAAKPDIVSFHFGLPDAALFGRVKATGAMVIASATSLEGGRRLAAAGCDAVIAQGWEAGGHASRWLAEDGDPMGLFALLPQMVDAVRVPVIAAGGIGDGRGIAAALTLGASAVQLGTAYLHCPESLISPIHRALLASDAAEHSMVTNLFTGGAARGLPNRLMREIGPVNADAPPFPYASAALAELRHKAEAAGDPAFTPLWAGQAAALGSSGEPARLLTERLAREALALLARGSP
ncbi:NAD(P)H-dependent flavin oxidoreductase [Sphingomonas flavalba]|uniref:NAD(P)H-dependent flavin oxidoreductase n=1 Tax=Sphingomonas flavalba TaxID=2559804 RepID=UPI00109E1CCC|nr:nitronate monooxygenase [Sphingomonas flavalba]